MLGERNNRFYHQRSAEYARPRRIKSVPINTYAII